MAWWTLIPPWCTAKRRRCGVCQGATAYCMQIPAPVLEAIRDTLVHELWSANPGPRREKPVPDPHRQQSSRGERLITLPPPLLLEQPAPAYLPPPPLPLWSSFAPINRTRVHIKTSSHHERQIPGTSSLFFYFGRIRQWHFSSSLALLSVP